MTSTARNRLIAVVALLLAAGGLAAIALGNIGENLVYYWSPSELLAQKERAYGPTIRLGGVVALDSISWNAEHTELKFRVADGKEPGSPSVLVSCAETPPQMFREGIGVVVEGTFDGSQVFKSNRLMVNHSNEYRPPSDGHHEDWKGTVSDSSGAAPRAP